MHMTGLSGLSDKILIKHDTFVDPTGTKSCGTVQHLRICFVIKSSSSNHQILKCEHGLIV